MLLRNQKVKFTFVIPIGCPNHNSVIYSKEAAEKAVDSLNEKLPIIYCDNGTGEDGAIIGNTIGETLSVLRDDKHQVCVCEAIFNDHVYGVDIDDLNSRMTGVEFVKLLED